jgi:hypothetical protein
VTGLASGAADFAALSRRLKEAGETGLRRSLSKALTDAAKPITAQIRDASHLEPYMPDRYARTLAADIIVSTVQRGSMRSPGVSIQARSRAKNRKVVQLDEGRLHHPRFGDRDQWFLQLRGMKAGFFTDPCRRSGPQVRDKITEAMRETAAKINGG